MPRAWFNLVFTLFYGILKTIMRVIVQKENGILRKIAKDVPIADITKAKIQNELADMREALNSQHDGVALAAPQIAISRRMFVVNPHVFTLVNAPAVSPSKHITTAEKNSQWKEPDCSLRSFSTKSITSMEYFSLIKQKTCENWIQKQTNENKIRFFRYR